MYMKCIFQDYFNECTRALVERCGGGWRQVVIGKNWPLIFRYMKKKIPSNLRSMIYLQELTSLVRGKSKLEFNKKPLEEGGGNGWFFGGQRIFFSCHVQRGV